MSSIHKLPENLINKIAAGEVVERPSSVVKELIENSLDAGATQIDIELLDGGKKSILVRDNGCGMSPEDLRLSIERHTTSKIATLDDLFSIHTLGFRGEALASIASVSKATLISKMRGSDRAATELKFEGGQIISEKEAGHPEGTTILVKYLFYQVPARLKFLKSAETEVSHIVDTVTRAALANPSVSVRLLHQERRLIQAPSSGGLIPRIRDLFGDDTAREVTEIGGGSEGVEVFGALGHPMISRGHTRHIFLFVNGRPVRDKLVQHAVIEGYRNLLMHGRFPFVVLFLKIRPDLVDVNVHPAKAEVRFAQGPLVHRTVMETVRRALEGSPWRSSHVDSSLTENAAGPSSLAYAPAVTLVGGPAAPANGLLGSPAAFSPAAGALVDEGGSSTISRGRQIEFVKTPFSALNVLGQMLGTYLVCEGPDKLVLVDQHAAYERIGFEKLLKAFTEGKIPSQRLLVPQNFDLNPSETEILKKYLVQLDSFGLEVDFFGGQTFVVRSAPTLFRRAIDVKALALDLIGDVLETGHLTSLKDRLNDVLARMACHGAIRAGDRLTPEEMRALLRELDQYPFSSFCPHGRPVSVEITQNELEKWFKRVL